MKAKILVVDDEPDALELIEYNLLGAGYQVFTASNGNCALELARRHLPDLIVLDLMLPEVSGIEVCKTLRRSPETADMPILMLTAKAEEIDRIIGLEVGADDYVTKPFSPRELILRIKNILRRGEQSEGKKSAVIEAKDLVIDPERHEVMHNDVKIILTATEFKLLYILAGRQGRIQSRERLLEDVWEYEADVYIRTVDTHMRRLRKKLGNAAEYIETVRGVGYRFIEG
jgi:two-component system phosphate regulon response regulator PhoB